jgi:membrane protease YdiL (CAAX protease family)
MFGGAIGLAVATAGIVGLLLAGELTTVGGADRGAFAATFSGITFVVGAVLFEEVLYRGIVLRYLELWLGSWPALGLARCPN